MSKDLIRRSVAIKAFTFNSKGERIPFVDCDNFPVEFPLRYIVDTLVALPSADRPRGEWIYCEDEYGIDGYRCSNCGRHIPWDYQHKFINFIDDYRTCPFCDARMKGADDETD